jgi:hypothetical protein
VRLFTCNVPDWTNRYPLIVEAALRNRSASFLIDGEAVLLGVDGGSDFDGLHSRKHDDEVILYAFDVLAADGDDLRKLPLAMRKTKPGCWPTPGMDLRIRFWRGEIGPELFRKACEFGLEGLVSKHRDRAYRAGIIAELGEGEEPETSGHATSQTGVSWAVLAPAHVLEASAGRASACLAPSPRFNGGMSDIRIDFSSR